MGCGVCEGLLGHGAGALDYAPQTAACRYLLQRHRRDQAYYHRLSVGGKIAVNKVKRVMNGDEYL